MQRQSWAAYGLIGLFVVLYAVSMFLPGLVLNQSPVVPPEAVTEAKAMSFLARHAACWGRDSWLHMAPNGDVLDDKGKKLTHDERQQIACRDPDDQTVYLGYDVLAVGWLGIFSGDYAWYANLLVLVAFVLALMARAPRAAAVLSGGSVLLGLDAFRFTGMPSHNVPGQPLDHLGSGYYVWEVSLAVLLAAQIVVLWKRRERRTP